MKLAAPTSFPNPNADSSLQTMKKAKVFRRLFALPDDKQYHLHAMVMLDVEKEQVSALWWDGKRPPSNGVFIK